MTVEIRKDGQVEASGDTVAEALWELKRNRPGDHIYPDSGPVIRFVDVRPSAKGDDGYGEMAVERLLVVDTAETADLPPVPPVDEPIDREVGQPIGASE